MPAFGGAFQPAPYKPSFRKFANPAPLGLCAFALTTFVLSLINAQTRGVQIPAVVVGCAYAYGGFIQLLAGMWEMAVGNTFGATALSSYGGFWISWAIIQTNGFGLVAAYGGDKADLNYAVGFFLAGWFIFTFMCLLCTFKSTLAFFALFLCLDITFLLLTIAHFQLGPDGHVHVGLSKAAGIMGLITAFFAWWNALAGMLETSNSFFMVPVMHFPWSEKVKNEKAARD
ncbi:GPR1/FUN34/yaaH family-domain-containing protein [Trichophaea hybrida]|nr:GPR1/FUN34/yaaH family-domain-containing protein [Trichophaea hybrida]